MRSNIVIFCVLALSFVGSVKLNLHFEKTDSYPNVNDQKIDISNNKTYKGRIFNGALIANDYTNISSKFPIINFNNTVNRNDLRIDVLDRTLTEDDFDNLQTIQTYSTKQSECNFNKKLVLERHNFLRSKHNATSLKWDNLLEENAKQKAKKYESENCPKKRDSLKEYGILVFNGYGTLYTEEEIVDHFYEGAYHWKWKNFLLNEFNYNFYDFVQILWKDSSKIGCSKACCIGNQIWICIYNPPALANDLKELKKNVDAPVKAFASNFD